MHFFQRLIFSLSLFVVTYGMVFFISNAVGSTISEAPNTSTLQQPCLGEICPLPINNGASNSTNSAITGHIESPEKTIISHSYFSESNKTVYWASFWMLGLILAFTPCVLPLLIIITGFLGTNQEITYTRSILLSLTYVSAMAFTFAGTGILAASFGIYLHSYFQNPWVLATFSMILGLLALSLMGFYKISLPKPLHHFAVQHNRLQSNYQFLEVLVMGIMATLITAPCVAAPLTGVLSYVSSTGSIGFGAIGLFIFGIGMGTPILLATTIRKKILPQNSKWQFIIKYCIGLLLLGVAIWLSSRVIPAPWNMILWSILVVFIGNQMLSLSPDEINSSYSLLWKSLGMIVLAYGFAIFVGFLIGTKSPIDPLNINPTRTNIPVFYQVSGLNSLDNAINNTKQESKPALVYFTAGWCDECLKFEKQVLNAASVRAELDKFMLIKIELGAPGSPTQEVAGKYNVSGTPEIIFFNASGNLSTQRMIGNTSAEKFSEMLLEVEAEK